MKRKKSKIDTYSTLYNIDIIVANSSTTVEELKKLYMYSDKVELNDEIIDGLATTSTVIRKSDNKLGVLVKFNGFTTVKSIKKEDDYMNTISHEAAHVCIDMCENINLPITSSSCEAFCYLLGYVTECINKTLRTELK